MLNKIKDKILHVLRNYCGYYELEEIKVHYQNICLDYSEDFNRHIKKLIDLTDKNFEFQTEIISTQVESDKLSSQYETKVLEYDILKHQFEEVVDIITNKSTMPEIIDMGYIFRCYEYELQSDYKKYLVSELEAILNTMKQKGVHPQDLIKRIINKASRQLSKIER